MAKKARRTAPLTPVPVSSRTSRGRRPAGAPSIGIANESMNDRWLLAISTPPVAGTFSRPVMVGRQIALDKGATTPWLTL